jgi:imidazolonepropionase-like amidohydrolase
LSDLGFVDTVLPRHFGVTRSHRRSFSLVSDRVFDGERFIDGLVRIEVGDGRITSVRKIDPGAFHEGCEDLRGRTVLPGLIDAHCHVARAGLFEPIEPPNFPAIAHNLAAAIGGGITTLGDMGCTAPMLAALRELTEHTPEAGPAIRGAGPILAHPRGYPFDWMRRTHRALRTALACGDERTARDAVRFVAESGMDHVKICIMHLSYAERPLEVFPVPIAKAIVAEARALGLRVLAHAHSRADYLLALDAGVDALMHSAFDALDAATVARVRDAAIVVCPTLWVFDSACLGAEEHWERDARRTRDVVSAVRRSWERWAEAYAASGDVFPDGIAGGLPKSRAREAVRNAAANLKLLRDAGVPFAHGSDGPYGYSVVGRPLDELGTMHRAGLDAVECLRAATSGAARLLALPDRGTISEGAHADLVVLEGDPRDSLDALAAPRAVYRAGVAVGPGKPPPRLARAGAIAKGMLGTVRDAVRFR